MDKLFLLNNTTRSNQTFQQFHLLLAALPLSPVQLFEREQKAFRLLAALLPAFNLEGGVVTAVFSLLPGLRLL